MPQESAEWGDWGDEALRLCKHWLVLEPMVFVVPKPDPKQTSKDKLGQLGKDDIVAGDGIKVDGVMWLKTEFSPSKDGKKVEAYILIDGKAVGVNRKFLEPVPG
eukprot:gnl/TRDRNA2_/TRDRNA2_196219_c0_seq1.p2 gnl/TRDRNA2_/TRDRNA2_196219_c0~~gnl/TRDRNA2_/TRDRNA2_196219_c0_seq1.p2  ORF type:complete len:104 (-),score=32.29 gnl/TRDRNA2_/TRDRNA2_196219_c0_seq1:169-480(-)